MSMKMRSLHIAVLVKSFVSTGGSQKYTAEIARRISNKGHVIDLYTREADPELSRGMNVIEVPNKMQYSSVLNLFSFGHETAKLLRGKKYDVIHSHERGYMPQDISTLHSFSYIGATSHYSLIKKLTQIYLSPRSGLHLWLENKQMSVPQLVAVSSVIKEDVLVNYHRRKNVSVITPGADINWFNPDWIAENRSQIRKREKISENDLAVIFVGSEFRRKGLDSLIPTIGPGMKLIVVGRGERLNHYKRLLEKHGISDRVKFVGLADNVREYYAAADVVVLPSLSEAFGMSILEGMACGLPVIASINSGVSSLIENEFNGFTVADSSEISNILVRLKNSNTRQTIGKNARITAEKNSWDTAAQEYEKLYIRVANSKI